MNDMVGVGRYPNDFVNIPLARLALLDIDSPLHKSYCIDQNVYQVTRKPIQNVETRDYLDLTPPRLFNNFRKMRTNKSFQSSPQQLAFLGFLTVLIPDHRWNAIPGKQFESRHRD